MPRASACKGAAGGKIQRTFQSLPGPAASVIFESRMRQAPVFYCLNLMNIQKILYKIDNYKFIRKIFKKCVDK